MTELETLTADRARVVDEIAAIAPDTIEPEEQRLLENLQASLAIIDRDIFRLKGGGA